jgi:hypothetical protein
MGERKNKNSSGWSPRQQPVSNHFSKKAMSFFKVEKNIFSFLKRGRLIIVA